MNDWTVTTVSTPQTLKPLGGWVNTMQISTLSVPGEITASPNLMVFY